MGSCKNLMIIFNILFLLGGCGFIGVGIWLAVNDRENVFSSLLGDAVNVSAYLGYASIGIGSIIVIVAFFGCCGAIMESKCLLGMFICFLSFFIVISIGIAAGTFVVAFKLKRISETASRITITSYSGDTLLGGLLPTNALIDKLQQDNQCCGFSNGDDYVDSVYDQANGDNAPWPESCCVPVGTIGTDISACKSIAEAELAASTNSYANMGCFGEIEETLKKYFYIIGGVAIGLTLLEILAIIFSCCVISDFGSSGKKSAVKPWS